MARRCHGDNLVGRGWAVERIVDWRSSRNHALVVAGAAGAGKTALVNAVASGRYPAARGRTTFHAAHLCQAHVCASTDPIRVLAEIAGQLARSVPGYQVFPGRPSYGTAARPDHVAQLATQMVLDSGSLSAAYDKALHLPFEILASRRDRFRGHDNDVVVVIDGLDEQPDGTAAAGLVDLFADRLSTPTPGVRLLLTVRSGPALARLRPEAVLDLTAHCPVGVDDVHEYVDKASQLPARRRAAIADAAGGCYLYADVAMRLTVTDEPLPCGLGALYDQALAQVGDPDSLPRRVLSVLAHGWDAGLSVGELAAVLHVSPADAAAAVEHGRHLLTGVRRVRPHHRCLSEHLRATTDNPGTENWMIGRHLLRRGSGRWLSRGEPYGLRNLLTHLADAAASTSDPMAARGALQDSLTDPEYVVAAVLRVGVDDLLSALSYVERRIGDGTEAATLGRVLRGQGQALRLARSCGDATLATQQLIYEAATTGASNLARRFAEHFPRAGILTLWATSDSPARLLPDAVQGHAGKVTSVVVTGDGTRAVTTTNHHATRVWRLASGRLVHTLPTHANVSNMYSEPGTDHVVASTTDGRAQVWDIDDGTSIAELAGARTVLVTDFAVNDDGSIGVGGDQEGNATVWDLTVGVPLLHLSCGVGPITAVAITPDAKTAATASFYGDITVWDLTTGRPRVRLRGQTKVGALALSPHADRLLVGNNTLAVYALEGVDAPSLLARLLTSHDVTSVTVNPVMPQYALFGAALGQVAYVRLPVESRWTRAH